MLGIPDNLVLAAFLGCIAVTAFSLIYGLVRRNAALDEVTRRGSRLGPRRKEGRR